VDFAWAGRRVGQFLLPFVAVAVLVAGPLASLTFGSHTVTLSGQLHPMVGEQVTYTATGTDGSPNPNTYSFGYDGHETKDPQSGPSNTWSVSFGSVGGGLVFVDYDDGTPAHETVRDSFNIDVVAQLQAQVTASDENPSAGSPVTFSANAGGGYGSLSYAWDTDGDGFDDGNGASVSATFSSPGPHETRVQVTDSASPAHQVVAAKTVTAGPACTQKAAFGIVEITTQGCLRQVGSGADSRFETTDAVKVNGIPLAAPGGGRKFVATLPSARQPGGGIALANTRIKLGELTVFSGDINWNLPAGGQGDEKQVAVLGVPSSAELFGLPVTGTVAFKLGFDNAGRHYATFPLNVALPSIFKGGPAQGAGGITGDAAVRVDESGPKFDGLKLEVNNAWIGKLKVEKVCLSFVPAFSQAVETCEAPELDGQPYITCPSNVNVDRWDGAAVIELPTPSRTRLAMFGGLAGGKLSKLGGFVDNLGTSLPITESVFVNRIGIGLCIGPPIQLRGDVGIAFLPPPGVKEVLAINGYFKYTDAFQSSPWSLELGGSVEVFDYLLGTGRIILRPNGSIDAGVNTSINLAGVVSLNGGVNGWLEIPTRRFNFDGSLRGCLVSLCAQADGVFSNVGVAGCVDAGRIVWWELVKDRNWSSWFWWRLHWERREIQLKAGFGYSWASNRVSLFGGSCYLQSYRATRLLPTRAAGAASGVRIPSGTPATALRIIGKNGPPKVTITGPDGTKIVSPADAASAERPGKWMLVENSSDGSTSVLLVNPAAGLWAVDGPDVASVETAGFQQPPSVTGAVTLRGGRREVHVAYSLPPKAKLSLVERGRGTQRTLARRVRGRACPGDSSGPGGQRMLCARVRFKPMFGPGGKRRILAVINRGGMPVDVIPVASYKAPKPKLPKRPGRLRLVRKGNAVIAAWSRPAGSIETIAYARLRDGRRLSFDLARRCTALRIGSVRRNVSVTLQAYGVRQDMEGGKVATVTLKAKRSRAGSRGGLPRRVCR
jgi:PKD domain-containing protein